MNNIVSFDYEGQRVRFSGDGWVNATEAAKRFGKLPAEWLRLPDTEEYLTVLAEHLNVGKSHNLVRTSRGRNGGTWLHPKLAVRFAQWLDTRFAVWCDMQIDALIRQGMETEGYEHIIAMLVRPEAAEWERRFPPEFYHALARVTNTRYMGHANGTPPLWGKITRKWVYRAIMPSEVLKELDARKMDGDKLHQWLTDGGSNALERQISMVTMIASSSVDYADFESRCMQAINMPGQLRLVYPAAA